MKVFCDSYEFKNLIKDGRYYKNPENPSCINLILTNNPNGFQNSGVIETGLSDFHKMTLTVVKTTFQKLKPSIIHYRDYRKLSNGKFQENLISLLSTENIRVFKNGFIGPKDNYRPVSVLPIISKIFEKLLSNQIIIHFDKFLSKYQCGFKKG